MNIDWGKLADDADQTPRALLAAAAGSMEEQEPLSALVLIEWADSQWFSDYAGNALAVLGMIEAVRTRVLRTALGQEPDES